MSEGKPGELNAEAIVRLDHNYCLPCGQNADLPPPIAPPPPPTRKTIKVIRGEEEVSRFRSIKYLFNLDESTHQPLHKPSPSKLEHLLKRTSMYDGPGGPAPYPTSPRAKAYNYYREDENVDVDVVTVGPGPQLPYDLEKAKVAMNECETHVNFARPTDVPENWEELIVKTGWTYVQRHLFKSVMKALHAEHFARLVYENNPAEAVLRRNSLDLTSQKVRKELAKVCWDGKLSQWLHGVLVDNLSHHYLAIYLDVLQTLRSKNPALVDRMIVLSTVAATPPPAPSVADQPATSQSSPKPQEGEELTQIINAEAIHLLIKRQWDPFSSVIHQTKMAKLKCNPVFLFVPAGPSWGHAMNMRRHKNFVNMLSNLGKVITVTMAPEVSTCSYLTVDELAEKMILSSKMKLAEAKAQLPDRPVYLVGWGTGSIIAATVSLTEQVAGVICLGFPIFGTAGRHGEGSDPLLQIKHPVLFVIGDRATNCTISLMERFREDLNNLQNNAYIVAIKSGDDYLRVSRHHRQRLLVTQSYVDKCIVDEIATFVNDSYEVKTFPLFSSTVHSSSSERGRDNFSAIKKKTNMNGEPMEGLALALSNGHELEPGEIPKKSRRKSYHRKSTEFEDDMSLPDLIGPQSEIPSGSRRGRPRIDGGGYNITGIYEANENVSQQPSHQAYGSSSLAYRQAAAALMSGGTVPYGNYPYFSGPETSIAYAAYAHVANQAAAIQHAIAMETVEGYNQYYSQLEQYNANSPYGHGDILKVKKPRKPREMKPKGEKPPRRPRQTKTEKAAVSTSGNTLTISSSEPSVRIKIEKPETSSTSTQPVEVVQGGTGNKPNALIDLLQSKKHGPVINVKSVDIVTTSPSHVTTTQKPLNLEPNTDLPPPSTTLANLTFSSSSPVVTFASENAVSTNPTPSSAPQIFAIKSLPTLTTENEQGAGSGSIQIDSDSSPIKIICETAPRSPPLLIPTQKSPQQNRIPIRLCIQKDSSVHGSHSGSESIAASLVPLPAEDSGDESLPKLVPVRTQPKIAKLEKPLAVEPTNESKRKPLPTTSDTSKLTPNEEAVEYAKNLQVKLPRITIPSNLTSKSLTEARKVESGDEDDKHGEKLENQTRRLPKTDSSDADFVAQKKNARNLKAKSSDDEFESKHPEPIVIRDSSSDVEEIVPSPKKITVKRTPRMKMETESTDDETLVEKLRKWRAKKKIGRKPRVESSDEEFERRNLRSRKSQDSSSDADEVVPIPKKISVKRPARLKIEDESSDDGDDDEVQVPKKRVKRFSKTDSSEGNLLMQKRNTRKSRPGSSDEEFEPKNLRSTTKKRRESSSDSEMLFPPKQALPKRTARAKVEVESTDEEEMQVEKSKNRGKKPSKVDAAEQKKTTRKTKTGSSEDEFEPKNLRSRTRIS